MSRPVDMLGVPLKVGQTVVKAREGGTHAYLIIRKVARIDNGKVWLDGPASRVIKFPKRLLVIPGELYQ